VLLKRVRIEAYLPDKKSAIYRRLRSAIEAEFLFAFGGCSVVEDLKGLYLRSGEKPESDRIALVYADMPFNLKSNFKLVAKYADAIREAAAEALPEQSILVVVHEVYHSA